MSNRLKSTNRSWGFVIGTYEQWFKLLNMHVVALLTPPTSLQAHRPWALLYDFSSHLPVRTLLVVGRPISLNVSHWSSLMKAFSTLITIILDRRIWKRPWGSLCSASHTSHTATHTCTLRWWPKFPSTKPGNWQTYWTWVSIVLFESLDHDVNCLLEYE